MPNQCYKCFGINHCLSIALGDSEVCKCIYYGGLKKCVDETVSKLKELNLQNPLSQEKIKELVYCCNRR